HRVFPESDKSSDIIDVLRKELIIKGVELRLHTLVKDIVYNQKRILNLETNKGAITGDWYIFAGGGCSYSGTGSDGTLQKLSEKIGHTIYPMTPSLIPLVTKETFVKDL